MLYCYLEVENERLGNTMSKEKFFKIYANLPINLRGEIILVLPEHGPITWKIAYLEIDNDTDLGEKILGKLAELNII